MKTRVKYNGEFPPNSPQAIEWAKGNLLLIDEATPYVMDKKTLRKQLHMRKERLEKEQKQKEK